MKKRASLIPVISSSFYIFMSLSAPQEVRFSQGIGFSPMRPGAEHALEMPRACPIMSLCFEPLRHQAWVETRLKSRWKLMVGRKARMTVGALCNCDFLLLALIQLFMFFLTPDACFCSTSVLSLRFLSSFMCETLEALFREGACKDYITILGNPSHGSKCLIRTCRDRKNPVYTTLPIQKKSIPQMLLFFSVSLFLANCCFLKRGHVNVVLGAPCS